MVSNRCSLHLFTWCYVEPDGGGPAILSPVCPFHAQAQVFLARLGDDITVHCTEGKGHVVGTRSIDEFDVEEKKAKDLLDAPVAPSPR